MRFIYPSEGNMSKLRRTTISFSKNEKKIKLYIPARCYSTWSDIDLQIIFMVLFRFFFCYSRPDPSSFSVLLYVK